MYIIKIMKRVITYGWKLRGLADARPGVFDANIMSGTQDNFSRASKKCRSFGCWTHVPEGHASNIILCIIYGELF